MLLNQLFMDKLYQYHFGFIEIYEAKIKIKKH